MRPFFAFLLGWQLSFGVDRLIVGMFQPTPLTSQENLVSAFGWFFLAGGSIIWGRGKVS